jgi:hypothetical protein
MMRSPRLAPIPPEIVDAFRAVAPAVEAFAQTHDLLIDRYRRGRAAWELRFGRHRGGEAVLTLSYRERTGHVLDLSATWWVDDLEQRTRRLRSQKIGVFDRRDAADVLRGQLEVGLATIDRWTEADLGPAHGPFGSGVQAASASTLPRR